MPSINTLVKDIESVIRAEGGWDAACSKYASDLISKALDRRFTPSDTVREPTLRMSSLGQPCRRKLWYSINDSEEQEELPAHTLFKFAYGDILEAILIALAKAAGHKVEGEQDELVIDGVAGHRDCVIDGVTVDVKSASSYSFKKFASGNLREDDPFGYISQLSSYVYAGRDHEVESHPSLGAFLVVDKQNGHICLDMYDFGPELDAKLAEVQEVRQVVNQPAPPPRAFDPEPDGKSGNMRLGTVCSYCNFKAKCHPGLRTFLYSNGPRFLTTVVKTPDVMEVK